MSQPIDAVLAKLAFADSEFTAGRARGYQDLYSHGDDVTIFGAFGGHERGWASVGPRLAWAAAQFTPSTSGLERTVLSASFGADHGYTVSLEGSPHISTIAGTTDQSWLRVTHVYRLEDGAWTIVHRHADPLVEKVPPGITAST